MSQPAATMSRFFFALLLTALLPACSPEEKPLPVSLDKRQEVPQGQANTKQELTVCVGAMITPQEGYGYYRELLDYLEKRLKVTIHPLDPGNYAETNKLLQSGKADFAFVCGGPYVSGHDEFDLTLLVAPVVKGEAVYYSYLIVPADSPARSLADLRGKTFAFTDPQSNSGKLVPTAMLARLGETPEGFFRSTTFTYGHDRSIRAVAEHLVDGAAVDSLIWEYAAKLHPQLTAKTRIIARSDPYGMPPIVVAPHLDEDRRNQLRQALLSMHENAEGARILKGMNIDRFALIEDRAYDSIRQMLPSAPQRKGQSKQP